ALHPRDASRGTRREARAGEQADKDPERACRHVRMARRTHEGSHGGEAEARDERDGQQRSPERGGRGPPVEQRRRLLPPRRVQREARDDREDGPRIAEVLRREEPARPDGRRRDEEREEAVAARGDAERTDDRRRRERGRSLAPDEEQRGREGDEP